MEIRIYEDYREMFPDRKGRELTDRLLSHALADAGLPDLEILRTDKGKPYVNSTNIYISASHSKNLFACLIGDRPLGSICSTAESWTPIRSPAGTLPVSYTHLDVYKRQVKRLISASWKLRSEKRRLSWAH